MVRELTVYITLIIIHNVVLDHQERKPTSKPEGTRYRDQSPTRTKNQVLSNCNDGLSGSANSSERTRYVRSTRRKLDEPRKDAMSDINGRMSILTEPELKGNGTKK